MSESGTGVQTVDRSIDAEQYADQQYGERKAALLQLIGADKLNEPQRELYLAIAAKYDLEPELRHLVIIDGKPYITRDGLLHVAHKSGDFDGIEVDTPALDADGKYWRTKARVYRKSFGRPFSYPGRYPALGGNAKYNEEMCIKVAEVMTLRRAFDVAAPVIEERWDGEIEGEAGEASQPASLADKIAARAAQIESGLAGETRSLGAIVGEMAEMDAVVAEMEAAGAIDLIAPEPEEATEAPAEVVSESETTPQEAEPIPAEQPTEPDPDAGPTLEEFSELVKGVPKATLREIADKVHPGAVGWRAFTRHELGVVLDTIEAVDVEDGVADVSAAAATEEAQQQAAFEARFDEQTTQAQASVTAPQGAEVAAPAHPVEPEVVRKTPSGIVICGSPSPYDDGKHCTMDKGHGGPHRTGVSTSW